MHKIFDEDFRAGFEAKMDEMKAEDERLMQELMLTTLTTKDGRPELTAEELLTEEEDKVDDDDDDDDDDSDDDHFRDDDSSSAVASPGSSDITPASSSGIP